MADRLGAIVESMTEATAKAHTKYVGYQVLACTRELCV